MKSFGDLLKHQRENKRLTQAELAKLCGLPVETIRIIEEKQILPSKIQMEKLSSAEPLELTYETLGQWKAEELEQHWQEVISKTPVDKKWVCTNRRWDCPCCLWPYTLHCEIKETSKSDLLHSSRYN